MNDLKFALRQVFRQPASSLVILTTLTLVTGVISFAFGVIQHETGSKMPFPESDRLVRLWRMEASGRPFSQLPPLVVTESMPEISGFKALGAISHAGTYVLTGYGEPKALTGTVFSHGAFTVAGIAPHLGRVFTKEDEASGRNLTILTYQIWEKYFDKEETIVGKTIRLNEEAYTVIGVMPGEMYQNSLFQYGDIWVSEDFSKRADKGTMVEVVGRLKPGVTLPQIDAQLESILRPLCQDYVRGQGSSRDFPAIRAFPLTKNFYSGQLIHIIVGASIPALVLMIAGFNITTVFLGRMMSRQHEIAVRLSLGASRWRLVRLLVTESIVIAVLGTACGLVGAFGLAQWADRQGMHTDFSLLVFGMVALLALVLGVGVGILPALRATRCNLINDLKETGGGRSDGKHRHRMRNTLVIGQIAGTTALCVLAGLFLRSYLAKKQFDPGFETESMITVSVSPRQSRYGESRERMLYANRVLDLLRQSPGVEEVSVTSDDPISRFPFLQSFYREEDGGEWKPGQTILTTIVSENFLPMLNQPVLEGRHLSSFDREGSERVVVVNESFARQYHPDGDALGTRIGVHLHHEKRWYTIVGIVPDRRNLGYKENLGPEAYFSMQQEAPIWESYQFIIQSQITTADYLESLRKGIQSIDHDQPISHITTLKANLDRAVERNSAGVKGTTAIGAFGLLMSFIGIYGVAAYSVVERTFEIGVRMSLGATRRDIVQLIIGQGVRLAIIGIILGSILSTSFSIVFANELFGIPRFDSVTYAGVTIVVAIVTVASSWLPALRASKADPVASLRAD